MYCSQGIRMLRERLGVMGVALVVALGTTACGAEADSAPEASVGSTSQELITWTPLTLINGWSASSGTSPAVGVVNGIITFRGIIKGNSTATDTPFILPASFRPRVDPNNSSGGWDSVQLRLTTKDNVGATLSFLFDNVHTLYETHLRQDGLDGPGTAARTFTSLDGVTVDMTSQNLPSFDITTYGWSGTYSFRNQGSEPPASAKIVNGFVRFQGHLTGGDQSFYLFTIPPEMRPNDFVTVPISLGGSQTTYSYGRLVIAGNGNVWTQSYGWDWSKATAGVSLEGAAFAIDESGGSPITLKNGWVTNSWRAIRARNDQGIIRLQGTVKAGTSTTVASVPSGMAPAKTVFLVADMCDAVKGRVVINTFGDITVDSSLLASAQCGLSFDGVSYSKAQ